MERKKMVAKFAGRCRLCPGHFEAGEQILWSKAKGAVHAVCPRSPAEEKEANAVRAIMAEAKRLATEPSGEIDKEREEVQFERLYAAHKAKSDGSESESVAARRFERAAYGRRD